MPRGRLLKTKVKEALQIAKAETLGRLKAQHTFDKVQYNQKNIGLLLKKRLLEASPSDVSKTIAVIGVAATIKNGIDWTQEIRETTGLPFSFGWGAGTPTKKQDGIFGFLTGETIGDEILEWLISYGLAYLIVENFGEIVSAIGTGLTSVIGLARTLLGVGLVKV